MRNLRHLLWWKQCVQKTRIRRRSTYPKPQDIGSCLHVEEAKGGLGNKKANVPLKGKSDAADYEAESSDRSAAPGPGYTDHEVVTSPLQNPVSSKVGKANKTSRLTKCYENLWDVSVNKKFNNLIKHAEDGILVLNNAADTLEGT
ncbi:unnamed protein product [Prunus armeniaca]|uniref:Uncharacterized protein n=1 Tax=Prunus armeniaca TaxID=36596 RepID=A0A6J5XRJ6_PRUAR|nr:unnamed protein product [Prunus armeniaca]